MAALGQRGNPAEEKREAKGTWGAGKGFTWSAPGDRRESRRDLLFGATCGMGILVWEGEQNGGWIGGRFGKSWAELTGSTAAMGGGS